MWTRKELKTRAKVRFRGNYWKAVLVGLVVLFLAGGSGTASSAGQGFVNGAGAGSTSETEDDSYNIVYEYDEEKQEFVPIEDNSEIVLDDEQTDDRVVTIVVIGVVFFVIIIVCIILIPLQILIFNPLYVGCKRFYLKNLKEDAQVREICYAFDNGYKNNIKTMFFRELYVFLWSLLLIIPGIIKSYEYAMMPYILAEHSDMPMKEVFALSKKMMYGNKWKAFLLDLSFFGWIILNICTFGILGIFYLNPYMEQTAAALYEKLKEQ